MGPDLRPKDLKVSIVYLVLLVASACKLDLERHCTWIAHALASGGLRGKGRTRMRPKLHQPLSNRSKPVLGTLWHRVLVDVCHRDAAPIIASESESRRAGLEAT